MNTYPVYLEVENVLDWTLERTIYEKKYIVVTLYKATPMSGMTLWWTRPLLAGIEEVVPLERDHESSSFQQAWNQAREQFKEKIQTQKKEEKFSVQEDE